MESPNKRLVRTVMPTEVSIKKQDGVWIIPISTNKAPMDFILDTGLGQITLSAITFYRRNGPSQ